MTFLDKLLFLIMHTIDKLGVWQRLPVLFGMIYLAIQRHLHQQYNLVNVGGTPIGVRSNPVDYPYRTADGTYNDPFNEGAGGQGSFFGRNILLDDQKNEVELTAPREVSSQCPLKAFRFHKTKEVPTGFYEIKTGTLNIRTPWWDGSSIYGSNAKVMGKVRTYKDGKLKISKEDGLLLHDEDRKPCVSTLQALFVKEHSAVCDALKKEYHDLEDEDPYRHARFITSAVISKIHTIDWTMELLKTDTMLASMRSNWYVILGKKFKDTFGHVGGSILGGLVGLKKPVNIGMGEHWEDT